jgi:ATP phosphoribosyltransferase regulatory subunit
MTIERETNGAQSARYQEALEALAQRLTKVFTNAGYEFISPAMIQPASLFLDVIGESLRARTYVFTDPDGEELCLRPDLTVPTCRLHLARYIGGDVAARYCYSGSAFRFQPGGGSSTHRREFRQAGIESFAAVDREQDEADVLALIIRALEDAGLKRYELRLGDLGLFHALLQAIDMPERWRQRLRHRFWRPEAFRAELQRLTSAPAVAEGRPLIERLDPTDPKASRKLVAQHLDQAGLELIGTRTLAEITGVLLAAAADARTTPLAKNKAALIETYVALKLRAEVAAQKIEQLARGAGVDIAEALQRFRRRLHLLEKAGIPIGAAEFSAEFGRNLEYYTGFVFELVTPALGAASPIAGGGRYDSLLREAGAPRSVAAVGSAIFTERLLSVVQATVP